MVKEYVLNPLTMIFVMKFLKLLNVILFLVILPEVPTPEVASAHAHLRHIAKYLPALDPKARVELLIGRDLSDVHYVQEQIIGGRGMPFAQKLPLGWVIIGNVCLGKVHAPLQLNVRKTHVLNNGHATTFPLCEMNIEIYDQTDKIFIRTQDDNKVGLSVEDKHFLKLMESECKMDKTGHWSAPLPFKDLKPHLPNNRPQAWRRAQILHDSLLKNPQKQEHFMNFMAKVISSGAAEIAPAVIDGDCWYLPLFGVYHPRKPGKNQRSF